MTLVMGVGIKGWGKDSSCASDIPTNIMMNRSTRHPGPIEGIPLPWMPEVPHKILHMPSVQKT